VVLAIWVWVTPPKELTLDDLPQRYVKLVPVEPEAIVEPVPTDVGTEPEKEAETKAQEAMKGAKSDSDRAKAESDRKKELIAGSTLLLKFVGTRGESRGGVAEDLWGDDEGLGNVDQALTSAGGATGDAASATRTGNAGGNAAATGGEINQIGGGQGGDVAGPRVVVKPKITTGAGSIDTVAGDDNQVKATVTRYQGQLMYCYEKVLKVDTSLQGRIEVSWSVAGGAVTGMPVIISNSTGDAELADCVVKKIRRWVFPPDVEGDMSYPFVFQPK
ncbi:MAG: AgmX/PglI C-terminal domain-containing protein, partial [Myxococcota bacterium]